MDYIEQEILSLYGNNALFRLFIRLKFSLIPLRKISSLFHERGQICAFGSGYGLEAVYLALDKRQGSVLGVEIDPGRVRVARAASKMLANVEFRCADINRENFPRCDGILMVSLLHHIPYAKQEVLIKRCYDCLNQNGILVILDPVNHPPLKYFINWLSDWVLYPFSSKAYFRSLNGLIDLLSTLNFRTVGEMEKSSGWGLFSYALVIGQK